MMRAEDLACGETYLVSAPAHDTGGVRNAADMASFNPSLRAEFVPDPHATQLAADSVLLRVAFESYATNLDPSITDGNDTRDIHYAELVVPIPEPGAP